MQVGSKVEFALLRRPRNSIIPLEVLPAAEPPGEGRLHVAHTVSHRLSQRLSRSSAHDCRSVKHHHSPLHCSKPSKPCVCECSCTAIKQCSSTSVRLIRRHHICKTPRRQCQSGEPGQLGRQGRKCGQESSISADSANWQPIREVLHCCRSCAPVEASSRGAGTVCDTGESPCFFPVQRPELSWIRLLCAEGSHDIQTIRDISKGIILRPLSLCMSLQKFKTD